MVRKDTKFSRSLNHLDLQIQFVSLGSKLLVHSMIAAECVPQHISKSFAAVLDKQQIFFSRDVALWIAPGS